MNKRKIQVSKRNDQITPDKASDGAFSRWLEVDNKRMRVVTYPKGYKADHICFDGHSFYILEGKILIDIGDEIVEFEQGDAFIIPNNLQHRISNTFDLDAEVVVVDNG